MEPITLQEFLKIKFPQSGKEKHFTDIYQQANSDPEAVFCDSFLHARCHEITRKQANRLRELMIARKKKIPLVYSSDGCK